MTVHVLVSKIKEYSSADLFFLYIPVVLFILFWSFKYSLGIDTRFFLLIPFIFTFIQNRNNYGLNIKFFSIFLIFVLLDLVFTIIYLINFDYTYKFKSYIALIFIFYIVFFNFSKISKFINFFPNIFLISYLFLIFFSDFLILENMSFYSSCILNKYSISHLMFNENSHYAFYGVALTNYFFYEFIDKFNYKNFFKFILIILISFFEFSFTYIVGLSISSILILIYFIIFNNNKKNIYNFLILFLISASLILMNRGCLIRVTDISHYSGKNENISQSLQLIDNFYDKRYKEESYIYTKTYKNKLKVETEEEIKKKSKEIFTTVSQTANHSTAIFLHNLQTSFLSFKDRIFYGSGFNTFYLVNEKYKDKVLKPVPRVENYNFNDGSSNFNKMLGEFGLMNLFFIFFGFMFIKNKKIKNSTKILVFTIILTQLIRGAGYFNGGFLLFISFVISSYFNNKKIKSQI